MVASVTASILSSPGYVCAVETHSCAHGQVMLTHTCTGDAHTHAGDAHTWTRSSLFSQEEKGGGHFVSLFSVLKQYYLLDIVGTCVYKVYPVKMARIVPL